MNYNNGVIFWEDTYIDNDEPFIFSGNSATFSLFAAGSSDPLRVIKFDDIIYKDIPIYDEPDNVVYRDVLKEGKTDGSITVLDSPLYIRRVIAENIESEVKVYASTDGDIWRLLLKTDSDCDWLNDLYSDKFLYIKIIGDAKIYVLSELLNNNNVKLMMGNAMELFEYFGGICKGANAESYSDFVYAYDNILYGVIPHKKNKVKIISESEIFDIFVDVEMPIVNYEYEITGKEVQLNISSIGLKNKNAVLVIIYRNAENSMTDMCKASITFDEFGNANITVNNSFRAGSYMECSIVEESGALSKCYSASTVIN